MRRRVAWSPASNGKPKARRSLADPGASGRQIGDLRFASADVTAWALADLFELQRRIAGRDLALRPSLKPQRAQVLDMFPQTRYHEVIVLLERG